VSHDPTVESVWRHHRKWSQAAASAQRHVRRWRRRNLLLVGLGAVAGALAAQTSWLPAAATTVSGLTSAVVLALAGIIQQRLLGPGHVARWTSARAASEALKAEVYRYLAGVAPYADADRTRRLSEQLDAVQSRSREFLVDFQLSPDDERPMPEVADVEGYITLRAQQQAAWHADKVAEHARAAKRLRAGETTATMSAAVLAAIVGTLNITALSVWIGVATTVGAALTAHLAAAQHDRIAASYATTAEEIQRLIHRIDRATATPEVHAGFVADVERVLAAQNEGWIDLFSSA
jgi:hypothetical protein